MNLKKNGITDMPNGKSGNMNLYNGIYKGKKVLITGHTGFKGSWLALWLQQLGATTLGYSFNIPSSPSHFGLLDLTVTHVIGDIRDAKSLQKTFQEFQPDIVFHLAAQALVRYSYNQPVETFDTNVLGTVNVFEACRVTKSVKAVVNVTSDKCYENFEIDYSYKETDRLGGFDPYSASKGCAEIVTNSYRNSFFNLDDFGKKHNILLASVRAGNVIGGGDWALDRLIPDIVKATMSNSVVQIRNPQAVRPWQHVLEPLSGYLLVGQQLLEENKTMADAWNFGPVYNETSTVETVLLMMKESWPTVKFEFLKNENNVHEAHLLQLDCSKAFELLNWQPVWDTKTAVEKTGEWYKSFYLNNRINTIENLNSYIEEARIKNIVWATNH